MSAAWNYINHKDNASKYGCGRGRYHSSPIKQLAKKHGVEISED